MKNTQPWKPIRPRTAPKCSECKGTGKIWCVDMRWTRIHTTCHKCGGKGFV